MPEFGVGKVWSFSDLDMKNIVVNDKIKMSILNMNHPFLDTLVIMSFLFSSVSHSQKSTVNFLMIILFKLKIQACLHLGINFQ